MPMGQDLGRPISQIKLRIVIFAVLAVFGLIVMLATDAASHKVGVELALQQMDGDAAAVNRSWGRVDGGPTYGLFLAGLFVFMFGKPVWQAATRLALEGK